jgi:hypothetical protein
MLLKLPIKNFISKSARGTGFDIHGSVHRKCIFEYNQQDATLHNVFISVKCSKCFRRVLRPSSGAQNCIHSFGYLSGLTAACRCRGRIATATAVPTLPRTGCFRQIPQSNKTFFKGTLFNFLFSRYYSGC